VGCVFDHSGDGEERELLGLFGKRAVYWHPAMNMSHEASIIRLVSDKATILHYRELAPDKNGKMLCEGDKIDTVLYKNVTIQGIAGRHLIVEYEPDEFVWVSSETITFVSRPTDMSIKSAEATKLEQLIKEAKESWHKLDEALKKAEEAGLCN